MATQDEKLEWIESKLKIEHSSIQKDAISSLLQEIENISSARSGSSSSSLSANTFYQCLIRGLTSSSLAVAESCILGVLRLVKSNRLELKEGLNDLLNSIPSVVTNALPAAIKTISELLLQGVSNAKKTGRYESPYTLISTSTHPYVTILHNRIESWNVLVKQLVELLIDSASEGAKCSSKDALALIWPFVSQVLLEPMSFPTNMQPLCLHLHSQLLRASTLVPSIRYTLLSGLTAFIPQYFSRSFPLQANQDSIYQLTTIYQIIEDLIECVERSQSVEAQDQVFQILQHLLTFYIQLRKSGHPLIPYFPLYRKLSLKAPTILLFPSSPLVFAWLLLGSETTEDEKLQILGFLHSIMDGVQTVEMSHGFRVTLPFVIYPLLQIISGINKQLADIATKLLAKIEHCINSSILSPKSTTPTKGKVEFSLAHSTNSTDFPGPLSLLFDNLSIFSNAETFVMNLFEHRGTKKDFSDMITGEWLESVVQQLRTKDQVSTFMTLFVAPFLFHSLPDVRLIACSIIAKIAEISPFQGISFLSLLLYQLKNEINPEVQLKVLYTIPSLATNQACVAPVLRVITPFSLIPSMRSIALRLFCKLWELQPRTFPKIHAMLLEYSPTLPLEVRISLASCIRDIIAKKAERGSDLISVLSKIISNDKESTPVCFALEALIKLCQEDIVDFRTAWGVINKSLSNDTRPLVVGQLCRFFSEGAPDASSEDDADKLFVSGIVARLWNATKSTSPFVRQEAYKSLVVYAQVNIESLGAVPASQYVSLLAESSDDARKEVEKLVFVVLQYEAAHQRRLRMALGMSDAPNITNPALAILATLPDFVKSSYENAASRPSVRGAIAGAYLFAFRPPQLPREAAKAIQIPRKYLVSKANAYKRGLSDILTDISSRDDRDWVIRLLAIPAWLNFMKECTDACVQGEIAQASINGDDIDERTATDKVIESLCKELRLKCDETPKTAENSALALAGLGLSVPSAAYTHIEKITDILKEFLVKGQHEWIQFGAAIGLGVLTHNLHTTDISRLDQIISILSKTFVENSNEWVKMACGIALGISASSLFTNHENSEERDEPTSTESSEMKDTKANLLTKIISSLKSALEVKQQSNLHEDGKWSVLGAVLGLGYSASAFEVSKDFSHLKELFRTFRAYTNTSALNASDSCLLIGTFLTLPMLTARLVRMEQLESHEVIGLLNMFDELLENTQGKSVATSACIGYPALLHSLVSEGFNFPSTNFVELKLEKITDFLAKSSNVAIRSGSTIGIANMLGSFLLIGNPKLVSPINCSYLSSSVISDQKLASYLEKALVSLRLAFEADSDPKVCRYAAWALGSLGRPLPPASVTGSSSNLSHLPESSLIRGVFELIQNVLSKSRENSLPTTEVQQLESTLRCLSEITKLPAVRWEPILLNLMKSGFGINIRREVVHFVSRNLRNSAMITLLDEWTEPSRFSTFEKELKLEMFQALPNLLTVFPSARSRKLVTDIVPLVYHEATNPESFVIKIFVLNTLANCLTESTIPLPVQSEVHTMVVELYSSLPSPTSSTGNPYRLNEKALELLDAMITCLKSIPSELMSPKVCQLAPTASIAEAMKAIYVGTKLLQLNVLPVTTLSVYRTWCISQVGKDNEIAAIASLPLFVPALKRMKDNERSKWLIDTFDTITLCPNPKLGVHLLSTTCASWAASDADVLFLNQNTILAPSKSLSLIPAILLPYFLSRLLQSSFFAQLYDKIIARVASLLGNASLKGIHAMLATVMLSLRHTAQSQHLKSFMGTSNFIALQSLEGTMRNFIE